MSKVAEFAKPLRGPDQIMTLLCELDDDLLHKLIDILEQKVDGEKQKDYGLLLSWSQFVRYMRSLGHLRVQEWVKQRPEFYNPDA